MKAPSTRKRPDFTGVPGQIVLSSDPAAQGLQFGLGGRISPYDEMLRELAARMQEYHAALEANATSKPAKLVDPIPIPYLRFPNLKPKHAVAMRARKLGIKISFAVKDDQLWIRCNGSEASDTRARREKAILACLTTGPRSAIAVAAYLRERGDELIDGPIAEGILLMLLKRGQVIRQEGNSFALKPGARSAK
jgi:hypothetical protein